MAHGDAVEGMCRGNWRMQWVVTRSLSDGTRYLNNLHNLTADRWNEICIMGVSVYTIPEFNSLSAELNPNCHLLALLGAHHILHVSRVRVKELSVISTQSVTNSPACSVSGRRKSHRAAYWVVEGGLTLWRRNYSFLILAHPVYKM